MNINEAIKQQNQIIIYGMGYIAQKFYRIMNKKNMRSHILCFAVTDKSNYPDEWQGIPIRSVFELDCLDGALVCIAVHEVIKDEIEDILVKRGCGNYIWVTPHLIPFAFDLPIEHGREIAVNELVRFQGENCYWFAARYLAIDQYLGKNNYGYAIYEKLQTVHCSFDTARKRLLQFQNLIEAYLSKQCWISQAIAIDSERRIIDGIHRTAIYSYWNESRIKADIYAASADFYEIMGEVYPDAGMLKEHGITADEMDALENMRREIWREVT